MSEGVFPAAPRTCDYCGETSTESSDDHYRRCPGIGFENRVMAWGTGLVVGSIGGLLWLLGHLGLGCPP